MKRFQKTVSLFAVALGLTAAFAFSAAAKKPLTYYWFDTNTAGVPTSYDPDGPQCNHTSGVYCAKQYEAAQLNFSGGVPTSVISGQENMQHDDARKGL